jgi:hypothetical protein
MGLRSAESQAVHDSLVKKLAEMLVDKHFREVKADHSDFLDKPVRIFWDLKSAGISPDVTAVGIQDVLFEVETADSLHDSHVEDEWSLFAEYANNRHAEFWVVVPKACKPEAFSRMELLGLEPRVMGI